MARNAQRLTKAKLDSLRSKVQRDGSFSGFIADAGQPGLYAWARRGRVRRPATGAQAGRIVTTGGVPALVDRNSPSSNE